MATCEGELMCPFKSGGSCILAGDLDNVTNAPTVTADVLEGQMVYAEGAYKECQDHSTYDRALNRARKKLRQLKTP